MTSIPTSFHVGVNPSISSEDVHGKMHIMLSPRRPCCNVKIKWCQFKLQLKKGGVHTIKTKVSWSLSACLEQNALPSWVEKPVSICPAVFSLLPVCKKALGRDSTLNKPINTTEQGGRGMEEGLQSVSTPSVSWGMITYASQSGPFLISSSIYSH